MYNKMTMEVILATAFGRAIDVQNGKGGKILESAVKVFGIFATEGEHSSRVARVLNFMARELGYILFLKTLPPITFWPSSAISIGNAHICKHMDFLYFLCSFLS